jgi:hypothetical protein
MPGSHRGIWIPDVDASIKKKLEISKRDLFVRLIKSTHQEFPSPPRLTSCYVHLSDHVGGAFNVVHPPLLDMAAVFGVFAPDVFRAGSAATCVIVNVSLDDEVANGHRRAPQRGEKHVVQCLGGQPNSASGQLSLLHD